ncbi:Retrovirus-related Pol polyprotein from transposon 17.6 [Gossypium australe]|uniref:Retrovirus-related Pol polyprotein from transposon 17.6 n=1 Tax=Gossypium australe TaxID=47621 RepID=A0A5B6VBN5_9ROSI|nr:Retrovirus-related Pol polyprotein from transposon 17.6 [Gossypium australe]
MYAFKRMRFGLCNVPETMRYMTAIFNDMLEEGLDVSMDDIFVYGDSFQECLDNLEKVFKRCKESNLVLNWEKCHFIVKEGLVLGHQISGKDFTHISKPLNQLFQKEKPFVFDQSRVRAFEVIKEKLVSAALMITQNQSKYFIIMRDASDYANNLFGAIHCPSKILNSTQCNYTTTEKEMLVVVFSCICEEIKDIKETFAGEQLFRVGINQSRPGKHLTLWYADYVNYIANGVFLAQASGQ